MKRFLTVLLALAILAPAAFAMGTGDAKGQGAAAGSGERKLMNYATLAEYQQKTGKKIAKFNEAPALAELVKAGKLPPVEKRVSEEPAVVQPLYETGKYGGELRSSTAEDWLVYCRSRVIAEVADPPPLEVTLMLGPAAGCFAPTLMIE